MPQKRGLCEEYIKISSLLRPLLFPVIQSEEGLNPVPDDELYYK